MQKLPEHDPVLDLSGQFADYFISKDCYYSQWIMQSIAIYDWSDETAVIFIF